MKVNRHVKRNKRQQGWRRQDKGKNKRKDQKEKENGKESPVNMQEEVHGQNFLWEVVRKPKNVTRLNRESFISLQQ